MDQGRKQEWEFLEHLQHEAVLPCLRAFLVPSPASSRQVVCMVTPLCASDLCEAIQTKWVNTDFAGVVTPAQRLTLAAQLCSGLAYLHMSRVAHRDIKPGNVLVQGRKLLIADLGLSKEIDPRVASAHHTQTGTLVYSVRSPCRAGPAPAHALWRAGA